MGHVSVVVLQDRALMDCSRAMKMTAAAGDGDHVQARTKESIVQDFSDGIDSCYFTTLSFFQVFC